MPKKKNISGGGFSLNTSDPKAVLLVNDHARGCYWVWYDKPRVGQAVMLRVHTLDAIEVRVLGSKENPIEFSEELSRRGWRIKPGT